MMTIEFDRSLFSAEAVSRAAHRWTAIYFVDIRVTAEGLRVTLAPKSDAIESGVGADAFRNDVLDEHLRELVRVQTHELHNALVETALANVSKAAAGLA